MGHSVRKINVTISINLVASDRLKRIAKERHISRSRLIEQLLEEADKEAQVLAAVNQYRDEVLAVWESRLRGEFLGTDYTDTIDNL